MCRNQGDFRLCINLNIELVRGDAGSMLMRRSPGSVDCVCRLAALTVRLFFSSPLSKLSSTSDLGPKGRSTEKSVTELQRQRDSSPYGPTTRAALPSITAEQPVSNYSGNHTRTSLSLFYAADVIKSPNLMDSQ